MIFTTILKYKHIKKYIKTVKGSDQKKIYIHFLAENTVVVATYVIRQNTLIKCLKNVDKCL